MIEGKKPITTTKSPNLFVTPSVFVSFIQFFSLVVSRFFILPVLCRRHRRNDDVFAPNMKNSTFNFALYVCVCCIRVHANKSLKYSHTCFVPLFNIHETHDVVRAMQKCTPNPANWLQIAVHFFQIENSRAM